MIARMEGFTMRAIWQIGMAVVLAAGLVLAQTTRTAEVELKAAQHKAEVEGDLNGAIKAYGAIVVKYMKNDRGEAAMALVRMADCYQKMGDVEARKIYEQVVREYVDQKEAVAEARARLGGTGQPQRQSNTMIWSGPRADGAASYDGRYISFTDWDTGDLAVHDIASGQDRYLTHFDNPKNDPFKRWADGAIISRDGRQLAYTSREGRNELYVANLAGDFKPRRLYGNSDVRGVFAYDWSPDDRSLSVSIQREDRTRQIGLISVPDGSLRVLKSVDWRGAGRIYFSPDGKYVGYDLAQSEGSPERDVFVMSVDGSREIHAVEHPSNDLMMGWSPDGKWLLFVSDRSGSMDLWGQALSDGKPLGAPERLRASIPVAQQINPLGITHSGALYYGIARSQPRTKLQLADFDFDTGKLSNVTTIAGDYLESSALGIWSPDGRQMVYKALRGPTQRPTHEAVLIRTMETGQTRELRPKLSYFGPMVWSPDGRSFLTLGGDLKGRAGVFQVDPETGNARPLLLDRPEERSWYPMWAQDGQSFYFKRDYRKTKDSAYVQVDLATGGEKELLRRPWPISQAYPSPDGRYLATQALDEATNSRTLVLVPTGGGEVRELMRCPSEVQPADLADLKKGVWLSWSIWAPDSRSLIVFKMRGSDVLETRRVPIDGGEPRKIDDMLKVTTSVARPSRSPDGRRIAFTVQEQAPQRDPEVWVLENFLPTFGAKK